MTVHLVTFSDESMSRSAELCVDSAIKHGVDGITWAFAATEADKKAGRGLGFWAWKPRVILDCLTDTTGGLARPEDGDILIYSDAGIEFISSVNYIIDRMDQDIFLFGNQWPHYAWCKRDIIEEVWDVKALDQPYYDYSPLHKGALRRDDNGDLSWDNFDRQVQASVIFFRVNDKTRAFVKEWLDWCLFEGGRLIDDSPSGTPNHPEFRENRHDQAILTTMAYRDGYKLHAWPAVYNRFLGQEFVYPRGGYPESDNYPSLFHHHRFRNYQFDELSVAV